MTWASWSCVDVLDLLAAATGHDAAPSKLFVAARIDLVQRLALCDQAPWMRLLSQLPLANCECHYHTIAPHMRAKQCDQATDFVPFDGQNAREVLAIMDDRAGSRKHLDL